MDKQFKIILPTKDINPRDKPFCPLCTSGELFKDFSLGDGNFIITIEKDVVDGHRYMEVEYCQGSVHDFDEIEITYCPMCGKYLEE